MKAKQKKGLAGASFDEFLAERGLLEECVSKAIEEVLALQSRAAISGSKTDEISPRSS